jgi:hypothetical protein
MSDTTTPLLSDERIDQVALGVFDRESVKKSPSLKHLYKAKHAGASQVREFYEKDRAKLLAENAALRERLAVLEGQGVEPFNGHHELPWERGETEDRGLKIDSPSWYGFARIWTSSENMVTRKVTEAPEGVDTVDFIVHACNTYYPTQSALRSLRAAAQVAADALNGSVFPNAISADELALLAMNNAASQKSIDMARQIADDHRKSQEASRAALAALAEQGAIPTLKP